MTSSIASSFALEPVVWVTCDAGSLGVMKCDCGWRVAVAPVRPGEASVARSWQRLRCPLREHWATSRDPSATSSHSDTHTPRSRSVSASDSASVHSEAPHILADNEQVPGADSHVPVPGCDWTSIVQCVPSPGDAVYEFIQYIAGRRGCPKAEASLRDQWRQWFEAHYPYAPSSLRTGEWIPWGRVRLQWKQRRHLLRSNAVGPDAKSLKTATTLTTSTATNAHGSSAETTRRLPMATDDDDQFESLWTEAVSDPSVGHLQGDDSDDEDEDRIRPPALKEGGDDDRDPDPDAEGDAEAEADADADADGDPDDSGGSSHSEDNDDDEDKELDEDLDDLDLDGPGDGDDVGDEMPDGWDTD